MSQVNQMKRDGVATLETDYFWLSLCIVHPFASSLFKILINYEPRFKLPSFTSLLKFRHLIVIKTFEKYCLYNTVCVTTKGSGKQKYTKK